MSTALGTQFADLTEQENEFGNSDECQWHGCGKTPTTHYAVCSKIDCLSREPVCAEHAQAIRREHNMPYFTPFGTSITFDECGHRVPTGTVLLFPK